MPAPKASPVEIVVAQAMTREARKRGMPLTGRDLIALARVAVAETSQQLPPPEVPRRPSPGSSWTWKPRADAAAAREIAARIPWPERREDRGGPESAPVRPSDGLRPVRGSSATSGRPVGAPAARPADRARRVP